MRPMMAPEAVEMGPEPAPESRGKDSAGSIVAHILFGLDLLLIGFSLLVGFVTGMRLLSMSRSERDASIQEAAPQDGTLLWLNAWTLLIVFGIIPLLWVLLTRYRPWEGTLRFLGVTRRWGHSTFVGVGLGGCLLGGVLVLLVVVDLLGLSPPSSPDQPDVYGFDRFLTWPLAIFTSFAAGFGEEIFFRGILYRWLGWWGQAPVFMVGHMAGGEPLQLFVTLVLGLLFGWLRHRGWSLWTLILGHAVYDFCLLGGSLILSD